MIRRADWVIDLGPEGGDGRRVHRRRRDARANRRGSGFYTGEYLRKEMHAGHAPHVEKHFESSALVRDIVIGMSDGLTVPFALAAGLSGAIAASRLVVVAGFAEIAAGSIAMGLGGYLAARSDADHYASELHREEREIIERTDDERHEVLEILESYGLTRENSQPILDAFERIQKRGWIG